MTRAFSWWVAGCLLAAAAPARAAERGVLILAHGGSSQWNRTVEETVRAAQLALPTEIAFGMAMHPEEVQGIQQAIDRLERSGVAHIIVVPLLISSSSEVMRQFQYVLGLRMDGPWREHVHPVRHRAEAVMTAALDDDPAVAEVLLERARELSEEPARESVVLVAHGPTDENDNARWLATMNGLGDRLREQGGFRSVVPVTMRDDAPVDVQEEATRRMRDVVRRESADGRALVVPLLLANGGIEQKIPQRLEGLTYVYQGQALLPHPKLAQWIAARVGEASPSPSPVARGRPL